MLAIIDYGVGNLFSLQASLSYLGVPAKITGNPEEIKGADLLILPGVGAFGDAMNQLVTTGLEKVVREEAAKGKPLLGICLGMQMLFESSDEYGTHKGLGLVPGRVTSMAPYLRNDLKLPHIGWNPLSFAEGEPLFRDTKPGDSVYYVHSYFATDCDKYTIATSEYGMTVTGAVRNGNIYGTQFHPEKSGSVGLGILRAFTETETGGAR